MCLCVNGAQWPCLDWDATFPLFSLEPPEHLGIMTPRDFPKTFGTSGQKETYINIRVNHCTIIKAVYTGHRRCLILHTYVLIYVCEFNLLHGHCIKDSS